MSIATADTGQGHKMGPALATFLVASNMIGSGVFLLPATLATVGSITVVGWVIAGLGALLLAAVFAFLSRVRPDATGIVEHVTGSLGRFLGFEAAFAYWLTCTIGNIAIAVAVVGYLAFFIPVLKGPMAGAAAAVAVIWILTFANIIGPRFVGRLNGLALGVGLLPILAAAGLGWLHFDAELFRQSWNVTGKPDAQSVAPALVLVFWAFLGLESASVCARVVRNPERNVPLATYGGVALSAVLYIVASAAVFGVMPAAELARSTAPFADVVERLAGAGVAAAVAACALLKASGTLGGWIMVTAQTTRSSAEAGYFPKVLSSMREDGVPVRDLIVLAVLMTIVAFATVQPTVGEQFGVLINVATNLSLAVYALCCVALVRGAGKLGRWQGAAVVTAVAGFAFSVAVIALSDAELLKVQGWLFLLSLPLFGLVWWMGRRRVEG